MTTTTTFVTADSFNAVGDGVTNDTAALQNAFASLGVPGGSVYLNPTKQYYVSGLVIPANCSLVGQYSGGFFGDDGSPTDGKDTGPRFAQLGSLLWVDSGSGITIGGSPAGTSQQGYNGNSGIEGCVLLRTTNQVHMGFPVSAQSQQPNGKGATPTANLVSSYAGTAVTGVGSDCYMRNCMVIGFNLAFKTNGVRRSLAEHVYFDCINGIDFENASDVCYIRRCHGWPYAIAQAYATLASAQNAGYPNATVGDSWRGGTAYTFGNAGDWSSMVDNFSFGYLNGYTVNSCDSNTLLACRADNDQEQPNGVGFTVGGSAVDVRISNCQAASQQYASVYVNCSDSNHATYIEDSHLWAESVSPYANAGVLVQSGNVIMRGGLIRNINNGVYYANAASVVDIDDVSFGFQIVQPINVYKAPTTGQLIIRDNNDFSAFTGTDVTLGTGTNALVAVTASGGVVTLPWDGDVVRVTGPNNLTFTQLSRAWPGRRVILIFEVAGTVNPGASGSNLKTKAGSSQSFGVGTTFQFVWDPGLGYWFQV